MNAEPAGGHHADAPGREAAAWLRRLEDALGRADAGAAASLFGDECYWRDLVAFTWNIKTCEGRDEVAAMLESCAAGVRPRAFRVDGTASHARGVTEAWFTFETAAGRGVGHLRLRDGRGWTLLTALRELKGFEEKRGATRELGTVHGAVRGRLSWLERREAERRELGRTRQPYVLIVGGGQGGLALAARLRRLEVPALVVEKNARPGDSWRKRYRSLCLHDPVWYDHMPYLPFPDHWPVFSPKDKLGDWLEMYAKVMEIAFWGATECTGARYLDDAGAWEVTVRRDGAAHVLRPAHLVIATGLSGRPNVPDFPGAGSFQGTLCHSSAHAGGQPYAGKRCVIIGANNSAHDICADLWEWGAAEIWMVQRSPTIVARSERLSELAWGKLYSEQAVASGITTERADLTVASAPMRLMPQWNVPVYEEIRRRDAALYDALDRAGFRCWFGEDGSGIHAAYLRRGSGYYIDVGASQLIADGAIRVKNAGVERIHPHSIRFSDGDEIAADLIVLATGYGPMTDWAEQLISAEVADRVGRCWGVGSGTAYDPGPWEGELRNMWKPTRQPGLWFQGGNLMQARHYSLYLALQLKARLEGIPTPVYGMPPVHHLR